MSEETKACTKCGEDFLDEEGKCLLCDYPSVSREERGYDLDQSSSWTD